MDEIDRALVASLVRDGRVTYQDLGKEIRLSANTVAERVRRLRQSGIISGIHATVDFAVLGRSLLLLTDVVLRDGVARDAFEQGIQAVPQVISADHVTGEYDYELRLVCIDTAEFESVIDILKRDHGVRHLRSRLVLKDISVDTTGLIQAAN